MSTSECITKRCPKCERVLPLTPEFWNRCKSRYDGFHGWCKCCRKISAKEWRDGNPKYYEQYRNEHPQLHRDIQKRYRTNHAERERKRKSKWNSDNAERVRKTSRTWRKNNAEKVILYIHNRRAKKKHGGGSYTEAQIRDLFKLQRGLCFHCGTDLNTVGFHRDHWIPVDKGGSNNIENIKLLCPYCNLHKSNKLPSEWNPDKYG